MKQKATPREATRRSGGFAPIIILVLMALAIVGYFGYKNYWPNAQSRIPPTPTATPNINGSKASECLASTTCKGNTPCMTNPASVFCTCMGGEEKIINSDTGQSGICKIDGKEYDEWEYFRSFSSSQ